MKLYGRVCALYEHYMNINRGFPRCITEARCGFRMFLQNRTVRYGVVLCGVVPCRGSVEPVTTTPRRDHEKKNVFAKKNFPTRCFISVEESRTVRFGAEADTRYPTNKDRL